MRTGHRFLTWLLLLTFLSYPVPADDAEFVVDDMQAVLTLARRYPIFEKEYRPEIARLYALNAVLNGLPYASFLVPVDLYSSGEYQTVVSGELLPLPGIAEYAILKPDYRALAERFYRSENPPPVLLDVYFADRMGLSAAALFRNASFTESDFLRIMRWLENPPAALLQPTAYMRSGDDRYARSDFQSVRYFLATEGLLRATRTGTWIGDFRQSNKSIDLIEPGGGFRAESDGRILVDSVMPGSALAVSGLRPGDEIVSINELIVRNASAPGIRDMLRIEHNRSILMNIKQSNQNTQIRYPGDGYQRAHVYAATLSTGEVGYVHLRDFYTDAEEARSPDLLFLEQYNKMRTQGYDGRGLIIDLRLNQGGRLDFVDRMLALFIRENVIGYYLQEGDGERTPIRIRPAGRIDDDPIVILIDEKTDAGAVLFAAVMRLRRNSLVLGHHSGKHGIVHGLIPYRRNHLISVPDRYMIGPDESNLHGVGIAPIGDAYRVNEALRTSTSDDSAESFEAIRRQYAESERIFRSLIAEGAVNDPLIARAIALMNTRVTR